MNKDEAIRCLDISKKKYKAGDAAGALKFAEKSVKLCETLDGTNWLSFVKANSTPKRKHVPVPEENNAKEDSASRPYTQEQVQGIKRILEKKKDGDLYGIFGLEKGCTENDIKKAYRKV
jgi:DnaJ family protein B protein 12